jgi:hypothetical protein
MLLPCNSRMERSRCPADLPARVWELILDYAFDKEPWVAKEPLQDKPGPPSGFWLLRKSLKDRLHGWICSALDEAMKCNGHVLPFTPLCRTQANETSFYAQKRAILALRDAPEEFTSATKGIEGNFFSTEGNFNAPKEEHTGLPAGTIGWSVAVAVVTQMSHLASISGPFLRGLHGLKHIDLRSLENLKEIGDEFLSLSSVEDVLLPVGLERIGNRFLTGSRINALDLSMTRITEVGDEFLSCTALSSIRFPSTLRRVGYRFMAFPTRELLPSIDLLETVLEFVGDSFLLEAFTTEVFLPVTLKVVPNGFLANCR